MCSDLKYQNQYSIFFLCCEQSCDVFAFFYNVVKNDNPPIKPSSTSSTTRISVRSNGIPWDRGKATSIPDPVSHVRVTNKTYKQKIVKVITKVMLLTSFAGCTVKSAVTLT